MSYDISLLYSFDGVCTFSPNGDVISFKTQRYYSGSGDPKLETWILKNTEFKKM